MTRNFAIYHWQAIVELRGHDECLNKIDALKRIIKDKAALISTIFVAFGEYAPNDGTSYNESNLNLDCRESVEEMETVVKGIP